MASRSRAREVADQLAEIIELRMSAGERLGTKEELRQQTGVAMGTLNEATRLLQERGLVTMRPGPRGGIFAATPDPLVRIGQTLIAVRGNTTSIHQAAGIREALEPLVAVSAARDRTREDVADLRRLLRAMGDLIDDDEGFLRANWVLHDRIASLIKNELLTSIYLAVHAVLKEELKSIVPNTKSRAYKEIRLEIHRDLVEAIAAGDEDAALRVVHAHALDVQPAAGDQAGSSGAAHVTRQRPAARSSAESRLRKGVGTH
ncbi:MAG TPA: FCD domain-containing protein [Propionibacteriaceae bacterium]